MGVQCCCWGGIRVKVRLVWGWAMGDKEQPLPKPE